MYATYLVVTDEVAPAERDAFLAIFSHAPVDDPEARRWFEQFLVKARSMANIEQLEGYDEMEDKFLESLPPERRMAGMTPEQRVAGLSAKTRMAGLSAKTRMAGLSAKTRMAGLSPEEVLPALPVEVLRGFSEEYLRSLPPDVAEKIRQRLGR